jgi:ubiquinone/menaquinone biosynthesis C-methylase UbiE
MIPIKPNEGRGHDEVRHFYDDHYYAFTSSENSVPWQVRRIANRLGNLDSRKVLDIACGTGLWLQELARRGATTSGMDISSKAVQECRRRLPNGDIREGVAETLPFSDREFDLVTCLGSLEHFLDQQQALREMRRVAKPGMKILILVPNSGFLTRRLGLYRGTEQTAIRETVRSIDEWENLFRDAGITVYQRWRDLHPLSAHWIQTGPFWRWPLRAMQAVALLLWPMRWQYQIYFLCTA